MDQQTEDLLLLLAFAVVEAGSKIDEIRAKHLDPWIQQRSVRFGKNLRPNDLTAITADAQSYCDANAHRLAGLIAERSLAEAVEDVITPTPTTPERNALTEARRELQQARREITRLTDALSKPTVIEGWGEPGEAAVDSFNWEGIAGALRERLGDWALIRRDVLISVINAIRGDTIKALPREEFEVTTRNYQTGPPRKADLYLRYLPAAIREQPVETPGLQFTEPPPIRRHTTTEGA